MGVEYSTLIVGKKITHQTDPDLLCNKHLQSEKSVILDVTPRPYYSKDSKIDPETLKLENDVIHRETGVMNPGNEIINLEKRTSKILKMT